MRRLANKLLEQSLIPGNKDFISNHSASERLRIMAILLGTTSGIDKFHMA